MIYDTEDQQQLMKQVLREEGLEAKGETRPAAILGAISRAKAKLLMSTISLAALEGSGGCRKKELRN